MRKLLCVLLTPILINASAQNKDSIRWDKSGMISLTLAQGGTRNWAPGGDRFTLAVNGFITLQANRTKGKHHSDNILEANYGLVNTQVAGVIKNDDKLDFNSRLTYELGKADIKKWRIGTHTNFRTQFADGYDYDGTERKRISAFLAPAILLFSPGIQYYSKNKTFNMHFSPITPRWVLIPNRPYELAGNYSVQPNEKVKNEFGSFASINYKKELLKNIEYRTRLDLFSDYVANPQNIDVFWTNIFYMKINKIIGVVYNFDLQYDDDTKIFGYRKNRPDIQLKSIFGVGLSYKF
jgi:hypothetical protein